MSEWHEVPLSELADLSGGFAFKSQDYAPTGRFILRTLNIRDDCSISKEDAVYLREQSVPQYARFELQTRDTLFVMVGATLGKIGYVRESDLPALLNQNMWLIRAKEGIANPRFVHYAFRHFVRANLGWASGSARDFVRRDDFRNLLILAPPIEEQRAIAHILGTLDDKIELNRQMNETLEAMGRALFKSWFVDFELFRDQGMQDSPLGGIPVGWETKPLDKVAHFLNGLALQEYPPEGEDYLPVIKIAELRKGITESSGRASPSIGKEYIVEDGDIVFSWSGSLEVCIWCGGRGALNQHLFKVTSTVYPKWFYYHWIKYHLPEFQAIAAGKATTMGHIQRYHLSSALVVIPPENILETIHKMMSPLLDCMINNNLESRTLAIIRDTLLPKLLSGELRVKDAERFIGRVV